MPVPSINFPSTLPGVKMDKYGFKPGKTNVRTNMESGLARVRRRYLSAPTEISVAWYLSRAELAIFEKFYDVDTLGGSQWFNINLVNGVGQTSYVARFKDEPQINTANREFEWDVSATLEVLLRPLI